MMVADESFDNHFNVSSSSLVMLRWREGLLFFRIDVFLARMKFAGSGGRCFMSGSTKDTSDVSVALFKALICIRKPFYCCGEKVIVF